MVQALFSNVDDIFQDTNAPIHTAHVVKNLYEEHECELKHMEWPPQSPDIKIIENLLCVLELLFRNRCSPPLCLKLYDSIPRQTEALQKAGEGPTYFLRIQQVFQLFCPAL